MSNDKNILIAERYAQSLIDLGKNNDLSYVAIATDLAAIQLILNRSKDLYDALTNPLVNVEDKENIIDSVFVKDGDKLIINFLKLLVERNRFNLIYDVIAKFNLLLDDVNNVARVEVVSAVSLNENEKNIILEKLSQKIRDKQISVKYSVDESIIAGLVFKLGDDVLDTSVSHRLEELQKSIIK